jgi:pimeloyl-ACP methyl ester carboxylesterase
MLTDEALRLIDVNVTGVRSPVLEGGPQSAQEAVVFVHGNPGSSLDWENLSNRVSAFARTIAPDLPGYGSADKPKDFEYTVDGYARHLDGILTQLGVRRAHLVLHDFGGPWGLAWAAEHKEQVASITLINIGIMPGYRWHYLARLWRTPVVGEVFMATATRPGFHLLLKHGNPRGLPGPFVDRMFDDFDKGTRNAVLELYRATDEQRIGRDLAQALGGLDRPVLVIWGAKDPYVPVRWAERQKRFFPRARVVLLDRSGHWPFADDPERVAAEVVPFLKQQVSA